MSPKSVSEWLTDDEAADNFGFSKTSLEFWRLNGCLALGRKLHYKKNPQRGFEPAEKGRGACLYPRTDLENIVAAGAQTNVFQNENGGWFTERHAQEKFHQPHLRLSKWRARACAYLGDKPIRAQRLLLITGSGRRGARKGWVWFYHEEDAARIVAHEFPGVEDDWLTIEQAKATYGFDKHSLCRWRKRCIYLEGRQLRAEQRRVFLKGRMTRLWVHWRADLDMVNAQKGNPHLRRTNRIVLERTVRFLREILSEGKQPRQGKPLQQIYKLADKNNIQRWTLFPARTELSIISERLRKGFGNLEVSWRLPISRPQANGHTNGHADKHALSTSDHATAEPSMSLSNRQYEILDVLYTRSAFSPAKMVRMVEVAGVCKADEGTMRKAALGLKKLISSKEGRGGGYWLTAKGKKEVELIRQTTRTV